MEIKKINLAEKFDSFQDHWKPRIIGALNGQHLKIAKLKGDFVLHQHDNEDEMFLIVEGKLLMELEDQTLELVPGELVIIPRGTKHRPRAEEEVKVLLFEPKTTLNTGNTRNEFTLDELESI